MELLKEYLAINNPQRQLYSDANSFMVYEIVEDVFIIHDIYCRNFDRFVNIMRFLEYQQVKEYQYRLPVGRANTETDLLMYLQLGFKTYKADDNYIYIYAEYQAFHSQCKDIVARSVG